jgi:16S rRNA (cytosine967-C5)-methyltransferase
VQRLAAEQDAILAAARRHLRPGGRLVYSVCTLSPGEERLTGTWQRRLWPHEDDSDGFYIAVDG